MFVFDYECVPQWGEIHCKLIYMLGFYFIVFLTIRYNTYEAGYIESSVLLSLGASCLLK